MTKPREKNREELQAEIEDGKKKIRQLENREKVLRQKLSQEERRTRRRLVIRGTVFESIVPEAKTLTDAEATAFLRLALTSEEAWARLSGKSEYSIWNKGRNYTPFRCNCGLADGLMKSVWRSAHHPDFIPRKTAFSLRCSAAILLQLSPRTEAPCSVPGQRVQPNTI